MQWQNVKVLGFIADLISKMLKRDRQIDRWIDRESEREDSRFYNAIIVLKIFSAKPLSMSLSIIE